MDKKNLIKCSQISVNCLANDPVDIRCGGPDYLGFDFYVEDSKAKEFENFVVLTLECFEIPLENITTSGTFYLKEENVWTKEKIIKAVIKDADYLQSEARRNYFSTFTR